MKFLLSVVTADGDQSQFSSEKIQKPHYRNFLSQKSKSISIQNDI